MITGLLVLPKFSYKTPAHIVIQLQFTILLNYKIIIDDKNFKNNIGKIDYMGNDQ